MKRLLKIDWWFWWMFSCLLILVIRWVIPRTWIPRIHDAVCWVDHTGSDTVFAPAEAFKGPRP